MRLRITVRPAFFKTLALLAVGPAIIVYFYYLIKFAEYFFGCPAKGCLP